jgi:hypothetical protein
MLYPFKRGRYRCGGCNDNIALTIGRIVGGAENFPYKEYPASVPVGTFSFKLNPSGWKEIHGILTCWVHFSGFHGASVGLCCVCGLEVDIFVQKWSVINALRSIEEVQMVQIPSPPVCVALTNDDLCLAQLSKTSTNCELR